MRRRRPILPWRALNPNKTKIFLKIKKQLLKRKADHKHQHQLLTLNTKMASAVDWEQANILEYFVLVESGVQPYVPTQSCSFY
jgi:hypothetical protein